MTLHPEPLNAEVGVRELHGRLSRYVQHVHGGRRVARMVPVHDLDPLADLRARGLVREPAAPRMRRAGRPRLKAAEPVSDLVADQRR